MDLMADLCPKDELINAAFLLFAFFFNFSMDKINLTFVYSS